MYATIFAISDLETKFNNLGDEKSENKSASKFDLSKIIRAPGSGESTDKIAHHQGAFKCDGDNNYIITGSVKGKHPYFYVIKDGKGGKCVNGNDYYLIQNLAMTHPGGIQVAENVLVVGLEQYSGSTTRSDRSSVMFFDISDESNIKEITQWNFLRNGDGKIASAVGLTKRHGQWILAVRGKKTIDFYVNDDDSQPGMYYGTFKEAGTIKIEKEIKEFQQLFLYLDNQNSLYMMGMPDGSSTTDKCWLHKLNFTNSSTGRIDKIISAEYKKTIHFFRDGEGPRFMYAACVTFYNDISQFKVYSMEAHVVNEKIKCNVWTEK